MSAPLPAPAPAPAHTCRVMVNQSGGRRPCGRDASHRIVVTGRMAKCVTLACGLHVDRVEKTAKDSGYSTSSTFIAPGGSS